MTDEDTPSVPAEDPTPAGDLPEGQPPVTIAEVYVRNYLSIVPFATGDQNNKADRQQYRLKAMDIALTLTAWEIGKR